VILPGRGRHWNAVPVAKKPRRSGAQVTDKSYAPVGGTEYRRLWALHLSILRDVKLPSWEPRSALAWPLPASPVVARWEFQPARGRHAGDGRGAGPPSARGERRGVMSRFPKLETIAQVAHELFGLGSLQISSMPPRPAEEEAKLNSLTQAPTRKRSLEA